MPTGRYSTQQYGLWLDALQATDIWLALMGSDPLTVADPLTAEYSGGGYSRPKAVWARPSPTLLRVSNLVYWQGLPVGSAVHSVAGFDRSTNGTLRFVVYENEPLPIIGSGGSYTVAANSIYVGLGA